MKTKWILIVSSSWARCLKANCKQKFYWKKFKNFGIPRKLCKDFFRFDKFFLMLLKIMWTYPKSKNQNLVLKTGHVKSFTRFWSRTIWNTLLESLWKTKSIDGFKIKMGPQQPEHLLNMFEHSKSWRKAGCVHCTLYCMIVHSTPHTLRLTVLHVALLDRCEKLVFPLKLLKGQKVL